MKSIISIILIGIGLLPSSKVNRIYQFRGENRDGIFQETNLLKEWPAGGPALLWSYDGIGNGFGTPVVTDDRIFVDGEIDSVAYLFALDLKGRLIYKRSYGKEWMASFKGSRSAPTVVNGLVYLTSGMGDVACLKAESGDKVWSKNMVTDFHGVNNAFGYSQSVLVDGDLAFCSPGGRDTNVVAMNRFTGDLKWICPALGQVEGFSSSRMIRMGKQKILITFSEMALLGIDGKNGELLWFHKEDTTGNVHANTPLFDGEYIYYVDGDGNRAVKLKLSRDGKAISEVWRNRDFDNIIGGVVRTGDYLIATGERKAYLKCLDMNSGLITDSLKLGSGNVIFADGMVYLYNNRGQVYLVREEGGKLLEISSFKIALGTKEHFSHPFISKGILYLRHGKTLMAYSLRQV
jgi:outer membrane protein assembly factor BamB